MNDTFKPFFFQALDALKQGDRRGAAALLRRQLEAGNTAEKNLPSVSELAAHIGEIDLAVEAARRSAATGSIDALLSYWAVLATYGRSAEALADIERRPESIRSDPSVLHFCGTAATQFGRFDEAKDMFHRALSRAPTMMATWLSLAMIKTFRTGDPDLSIMDRLERQPGGRAADQTMLSYALGKAYEDLGEHDRAFSFYAKGARLRRNAINFDIAPIRSAGERIIRDYTSDNLIRLVPSKFSGKRSLLVTGLPRSGTTLTAQILRGHSSVVDGEEINLFGAALMPTLGINLEAAFGYERRLKVQDPWGEIASDYAHLIDIRFQSKGLIVDKSLGQSLIIGLMLHSMPDARIAWLRRSPDDVALSCFRTYFSTAQPWSWSLTDIADYMRVEDRLFDHWSSLFGDRILTVPYEELVQSPTSWAKRLQEHFDLPVESGLELASRNSRSIGTASVSQVREPISTTRIGQAAKFHKYLTPFRDRYFA